MAKQTGSLDLRAAKKAHDEAKKVATNYVTDITNGIFVAPEGEGPSDTQTPTGWKISSALELIKNGITYLKAWLAGTNSDTPTVQVGPDNAGHTTIDSNGMRVYGGLGDRQLASIGYGDGTNTSGGFSKEPFFTFGKRANATDIGNYSVSEGYDTEASGFASHAEGNSSIACSGNSHSEGLNCQAGQILGGSRLGVGAHAEGSGSVAKGEASHAQNYHTIASMAYQTAIGKYNIEDVNEGAPGKIKAFIIGNGTQDSARSNAFSVAWNGNVEAAGDITDGRGNVLKDKLDVSGVLNMFYPVGSYYETSDTTFDPNTAWGGRWVLETAGKFHVSAGTGYAIGSTGGSADAIIPYHRHSVAKVDDAITGGAHTHDIANRSVYNGSSNYTALHKGGNGNSTDAAKSNTHKHDLPAHNTDYAGTSGNRTGANMPPYIAVNRWHRTA